MLKKTSDDVEKHVVFFIGFSSILREKSMENRAKSMKNAIVHKNQEKIAFGTPFFSKKSIFYGFLGSPWVARGLPGRPGNVLKSSIFLIYGQLRLKTSPDGLREASGRPRGSSQASPGYHFASIFGSILHVKNKQKMQKVLKNSKHIKELVTLIRASDELLSRTNQISRWFDRF